MCGITRCMNEQPQLALAQLVVPGRRAFFIINHGHYYHLCTITLVEVQETLENLMMACLYS